MSGLFNEFPFSGINRMTLPPLYKYLDVEGARLTLRNGNFRHAKPSDFNDTEDLTVRSIFPESDEAALEEIKNNFADVLVKNQTKEPTCINLKMRQQVAVILKAFRANPDAARISKEIIREDELSKFYNLEELKRKNKAFVDEINRFMQDFRVLCVSEDASSRRMWARYAQDSHGIALRILPNASKDSKFTLFRKVRYHPRRPPLYKDVLEFLESGLFGDQQARIIEVMEDIIYSKTTEWEYEDEYRLAIPISDGEDWNTDPYHPEEIPELYFGYNATERTKIEISELAKQRNPLIKIYYGCLEPDGRILFI